MSNIEMSLVCALEEDYEALQNLNRFYVYKVGSFFEVDWNMGSDANTRKHIGDCFLGKSRESLL